MEPLYTSEFKNLDFRVHERDVTIVCSDGVITTYQWILANFKDSFFCPALSNQSFNKKKIINLKDYSKEALELCIDLMSTEVDSKFGHFDEIAFSDLLELYKLMDMLALLDLKDSCEKAIKEHLSLSEEYLRELSLWVKDYGVRLPEGIIYWRLNDEIKEVLLERYKVEVEAGDTLAMNLLGDAYKQGIGIGTSDRLNLAFEMFERAANLGDIRAINKVADAYRFGLGPKQSLSRAFKWDRKAARLGDKNAMMHLADAYQLGRIIPVNLKSAFKWTKRAAHLGRERAILNLALFYKLGRGTPINLELAEYWRTRGKFQTSSIDLSSF